MKLEPNMYVRTKEGFIAKIQSINEDLGGIDCDSSVKTMYEEHYSCLWGGEVELVVKASHNIIDLIQVGDYVNGEQVRYIEKDTDYCVLAIDEDYTYIIAGYDCDGFTKPIKSIVTKEMYSSVEYKVGE